VTPLDLTLIQNAWVNNPAARLIDRLWADQEQRNAWLRVEEHHREAGSAQEAPASPGEEEA